MAVALVSALSIRPVLAEKVADKAEAAKAEPAKAEPAKAEPAKPEAAAQAPATGPEVPVAEAAAPAPAPEPAPENALDACQDGQDNDLDGKADCADEECQIFAICVGWAPPEAEPEPAYVPETGARCWDNQDNNNDGLTDCYESSCQRYRHCRKLMYEVPEPPNKAPGFFLNFGIGVALPNYRTPTATTRSIEPGRITDQYDVPFDPDIGVIGDIKAGYLPLKFLGVGVKFLGALTGANNQSEYMLTRDNPDLYKYRGNKTYTYVGGFVRLQWPFDRFVPYVDVAVGGYSVARYKWNIYDAANSWSDIDKWEEGEDERLVGQKEKYTYESRHYTFALEPGFDIFVAKRKFAVGLKAWLPVVAVPNGQSSTDNTGVTLSLTYTPMWREDPRLKPEYDQASGAEE